MYEYTVYHYMDEVYGRYQIYIAKLDFRHPTRDLYCTELDISK